MTWWHYLLLVNFYLVLFFGFYVLLLRRETFFQLNRIYLVASAMLSFFIPLIQLEWVKNLFITRQVQATIYSSPVMDSPIMVYFTPANSITVGDVLNCIYIGVTLFLLLRLIWQLVVLKKAIAQPSPSAAYSFFKKISLGHKLENAEVIAAHEEVHAGQWHSVDVLIIEAVMIINWFNPVVYLYRFAIKYIHEFIADKEVIQAGTDKADYALLLLSQTFDVPTHKLVNHFYNHTLLKQRIKMLQKNRSQRIALAKYGLSAPLFVLMMVFSSATINNSKVVNAIHNKADDVFSSSASDVIGDIAGRAQIPGLGADTASVQFGKNGIIEAATKKNNATNNLQNLINTNSAGGKTIDVKALDTIKPENLPVFVVDGVVQDKNTFARLDTREIDGITIDKNASDHGSKHGVIWVYTKKYRQLTDTTKGDKVFMAVEKQPSFPGGMQGFYEFLSRNVKYPADMYAKNIQGKVFVSFIIEKDGTLSGIKAIRGPGYGSEEEAVRVLGISPKWAPGFQNGRPVRVSYTVPINFTLNNPTLTNPDDKVFMAVEKQPKYPGGFEKFYEFIAKTIRYPAEMRENKITGLVFVQFIVEADGTLSDIKAIRHVGHGSAEEAVRVLSLSPKWIPGSQNGRPVRVMYTVPISFALGNNVIPAHGSLIDTDSPKLGYADYELKPGFSKPAKNSVNSIRLTGKVYTSNDIQDTEHKPATVKGGMNSLLNNLAGFKGDRSGDIIPTGNPLKGILTGTDD